MKHIFLNLKRFDILPEDGGVNRLAPFVGWARCIVDGTREAVEECHGDAEFAMFFPEAHLLEAAAAGADSSLMIGCQGVFREDTEPGGGFGAFTTSLTAHAARAAGCEYALIGHCEERKDKEGIIRMGGGADFGAVNRILNSEVKLAQKAGMKVLYCIGEKEEEQDRWQEVLTRQLNEGLDGADRSRAVIAYEPVWAIGPGKVPPGAEYIRKITAFVKEITGGMDVVYGGGLKKDNAAMLAGVEGLDGGLIALTRFQGEIGFYPEEYQEIVRLYLGK